MDNLDLSQQIASLTIRLGEVVLRNTAGAVATRVQKVKAKRNDQETINELDDIINDLLSDRSDLILLAEAYKEEFVAQHISPEDIKYITETVVPILRSLIEQASGGQDDASAASMKRTMDALAPLLSVETLTVLQLVGFNFKKAIGEPLTLLLQEFIASKVPEDPQSTIERNRLMLAFNIELLKVAQDPDATARWERLRSA